MTPVTPPTTNWAMKPTANRSGTRYSMLPRQSVASQLKIFMPVGTATKKEAKLKKMRTPVASGVANMWCAQTNMLISAIAAVAVASAR